jgi:pimeloyl-ACP methyl ester carboxylesterase
MTGNIAQISDAALAKQTAFRWKTVDGIRIFYREAGSPTSPTLVLLHGFPTSSHMYRDLIPQLASEFHLVAPDYPGFGYTDQPPIDRFKYTFDSIAGLMDRFLDAIGVKNFSIYIQDYGAPIGFRLFTANPKRIQSIISQNGNAYDEGLGPFWDDIMKPYWANKNPETEKKMLITVAPETTKYQYTEGYLRPELISPDTYTLDQVGLDRPGNAAIQLALAYDYQNNVKLYPAWHEALRRHQPPVLAVWGKNDPFFIPPGAEAFKKDVRGAWVRFVDSGHFALEDRYVEIAEHIKEFRRANPTQIAGVGV